MKSQEVKDLMEAYASIYEQADERSPEYSRKKQEAAKEAAQKAREAAAKPKSAIEKEGAVDRRTQQLGREAMRRAGIGNPHASGDLHNSADLFDIVKGYLVSEGATEEEVYDMMAHLTAEQVEAIVEGVGTYKDPVLGPHTPGGQAVRKIVRMGKSAVKGFQGSQAQGVNRLGDAIDAAQKEYQK